MDHLEFHDDDRATKFLLGATSDDDPRITGKIMLWTERIMDTLMPDESSGDNMIFEADTAAVISDMIRPVTVTVAYPSFERSDLQ